MSCTRICVDPTDTLTSQGIKRYSGEERPKLSASFYSYRLPKLSVSITTNQLVRSGLMVMETGSLGGQEPENETDSFGRSSVEGAVENRILKCDGR